MRHEHNKIANEILDDIFPSLDEVNRYYQFGAATVLFEISTCFERISKRNPDAKFTSEEIVHIIGQLTRDESGITEIYDRLKEAKGNQQ